jgi:hypothetical protein
MIGRSNRLEYLPQSMSVSLGRLKRAAELYGLRWGAECRRHGLLLFHHIGQANDQFSAVFGKKPGLDGVYTVAVICSFCFVRDFGFLPMFSCPAFCSAANAASQSSFLIKM